MDRTLAKTRLTNRALCLLASGAITAMCFANIRKLPDLLQFLFIPALLLTLYLSFFDISYRASTLLLTSNKFRSKARHIYFGWCAGVHFFISHGSLGTAFEAITNIPQHINSNGLATLLLFVFCGALFITVKGNAFPKQNIYSFLPAIAIILVASLPEGVAKQQEAIFISTGFLLAISMLSMASSLGFSARTTINS